LIRWRGARKSALNTLKTSSVAACQKPPGGRILVVVAGSVEARTAAGAAQGNPSRRWMDPPMIRNLMATFILAGALAALATSPADAQSPDPALLAPPDGRAGLAPPIWLPQPAPQYTYPAPRPGGTPPNMVSRRGRHLSHPRVHGH
jgi:hypothetical protein